MANHFNINRTQGSGNTTVLVSAKDYNRTNNPYEGLVTVRKNTLRATVSLMQYFRPIVAFDGTTEMPEISPFGGTLYLHINSLYPFWINQCPDNIENLHRMQEFEAGDYHLTLHIGQNTSSTVAYNTIQIAFNRLDGRRSTDTEDGRNGFLVRYTQDAVPSFEVTGIYDIDGQAVALPLSALSREYYIQTNATFPITATCEDDGITIDYVQGNRVFFTLDENIDNDGYRGFTVSITDNYNTVNCTFEQLNVYADVEYVYDNGEITTGEDEYGRPIIGRFSDEFGMSFITDVAGGYLDFDVEADDEYPFRGYNYDEDLDRYIIFITKNYSGSDRVLRVSIMDGNGSMITKTEILQEG